MWIGKLIQITLAAMVLAFLWLAWKVDGWTYPAGLLLAFIWLVTHDKPSSNKKAR